MKLSERASRIGESATLEVSRRARELRESGVEVINPSAGEPDFDSPPEAIEAAIEALRGGMTRYTAAAGLIELRRELAADYRRRYASPWTEGDVVVTVGGKAALLELVLALVDDGDEVVLPSPYWVTFPEQIKLAGGRVVVVETRSTEGFRLHADEVVGALGPSTRVVILNSPGNPTGAVIGAADLRLIVEACAARGIFVIADETYERFLYDGGRFSSAAELAADFPETVIVVGSFSKTYAMTGWRVGFLLGPAPVVKATIAIQSHATSNPTTFAMVGALAALRESGESVVEMTAEYQVRRDLVVAGMAAIPGFECQPPAGSFYAFPRVSDCYRKGSTGSTAFCRMLLDEARVATVPGAAFGADDFLRISFACSRRDLEEGLARLAAVADRLVAGSR